VSEFFHSSLGKTMRIATPSFALASLGISILLTGVAILSLGSDRWVARGYVQSVPRSEVLVGARDGKSNAHKSIVATEAEWLALRPATSSRLLAATMPSVTHIDLGPLEIIDVRPLPGGMGLGVEAGDAKVLVTAREPGAGRIVRLIVDAAMEGSAARAGKHNGL
jgi:hypothetical protein